MLDDLDCDLKLADQKGADKRKYAAKTSVESIDRLAKSEAERVSEPAVAAAFDSGVAGGVQAWNLSQASGVSPNYGNNPIW
ncbi:MAG: hypothetical protein AAF236_16815, partial [Verrucomicrobiota bacterium]